MSMMKPFPEPVNVVDPPLYTGRIWCPSCGCTGAFLYRDPDSAIAEVICPECCAFEPVDLEPAAIVVEGGDA